MFSVVVTKNVIVAEASFAGSSSLLMSQFVSEASAVAGSSSSSIGSLALTLSLVSGGIASQLLTSDSS